MDIFVPNSWLNDYLETKATPTKIAEYMSLCGPSIEKTKKVDGDLVYLIEVTANRVDTASVYGIAREAAAILPRFGVDAKLSPIKQVRHTSNEVYPIKIIADKSLVSRITSVVINDVHIKDSSNIIKKRLELVGQRPINNIIDITNYVMYGFGTPIHAFDLDKLTTKKIVVREAKKGELITTLDGKPRKMIGGEVVFDDGQGTLIDLPGIMGAENTKVDEKTKNVLLLTESVDHLKIRKASLSHELRTFAATLNEKQVDIDSLPVALNIASELCIKEANGNVGSEVYDWYPKKKIVKPVKLKIEFLQKSLGINIKKEEITKILKSLLFDVKWNDNDLTATPPSFRSDDILIKEDILEEVARLYGYFNLPSNLPTGKIPAETRDPKFDFEYKIKNILKGFGGIEAYTLSMVSAEMVDNSAPEIRNPLGSDGAYMRTSITPSLLYLGKQNMHEKDPYFVFEVANTYMKKKKGLPQEMMTLGILFANFNSKESSYEHAKGIVEALYEELNIEDHDIKLEINGNYFTFEVIIESLMKKAKSVRNIKPIPKFPPQVEDITLVLGPTALATDIMKSIYRVNSRIARVQYRGRYENAYTFRISYQDPEKTLTDKEVEVIRKEIISYLLKNFDLSIK